LSFEHLLAYTSKLYLFGEYLAGTG